MDTNKRNIVLTLMVITLIFIILGLMYLSTGKVSNNKENDTNLDYEDTVIENKDFVIDLISYKVYIPSDLDFGFVIADIRAKNNKDDNGIKLDLSNFKTTNTTLDDVVDYIDKLEEMNYYLVKQGINDNYQTSESVLHTSLFIPFNNKSESKMTLNILDLEDQDIVFDLSDNIGSMSDLYYKADEVITDNKSYEITVSNAIEITGDELTRTYDDGYSEAFMYSSTTEVYAFILDVKSINGENIIIEEATYTVSDSNISFNALDGNIKSMKYDNIINKEVNKDGTGALLFLTINPEQESITYTGNLSLKLKGTEETINIKVDL